MKRNIHSAAVVVLPYRYTIDNTSATWLLHGVVDRTRG